MLSGIENHSSQQGPVERDTYLMIISARQIGHALQSDLKLGRVSRLGVEMLDLNGLLDWQRSDDRPEEVLRISVSEAREVDRLLFAFDGVRKACGAAWLAWTLDDIDSFAGLFPVHNPVGMRVGVRKLLACGVKLNRVFSIEAAVLLACYKDGLLGTF